MGPVGPPRGSLFSKIDKFSQKIKGFASKLLFLAIFMFFDNDTYNKYVLRVLRVLYVLYIETSIFYFDVSGGSLYPIYHSQGWPIYEPSISHLAQIWAKMPIFLWKSGPHLGHWFICGPHSQKTYRIYTTPVVPKEICATRKSDAPSRRGRHSGERIRSTGSSCSRGRPRPD